MDVPLTPTEALREAVRRYGSQSAAARALGVKQPTVWYWLKHGIVPGEQAGPIAEQTGVPKHFLRPDLFEAPTGQSASSYTEAPPVLSAVGSHVRCNPPAPSHPRDAA